MPALVAKYYTAAETKPLMDEVFESLEESVKAEQVLLWGKEEARALKKRGEAMRVFDLRLQKGSLSLMFRGMFWLTKMISANPSSGPLTAEQQGEGNGCLGGHCGVDSGRFGH